MSNRLDANKAFYILLTIFTFGLFLIFSLVTKVAPLTISHTIYFCQKELNNLMVTLPHSFPSILVFLLLIILFIGFSLLMFQVVRTYLFINNILKHKTTTPRRVKQIASKLGIVGKIDVVKVNNCASFCYGLFSPRICLSLDSVKLLYEGELKAVLIHENYHLINRDPLKILLSQVANSMFFFIPTIRDIHSYYILSKELAADQMAVQAKEIKNLRLALIKTLTHPTQTFSGIASFASEADLEQRIKVLAENKKLRIHISVIRLSLSFFVFLLAMVALNLPVYAVENGNDTHSYFICTKGGECMLSCTKEGVINEEPFSSQTSFTPMNQFSSSEKNYSVAH